MPSLLKKHLKQFSQSKLQQIMLLGSSTAIAHALAEIEDGDMDANVELIGCCTDTTSEHLSDSCQRTLQDEWWEGIDGAIIVEEQLDEIMHLHGLARPLKERGVPVASSHNRLIFTATPPPRAQGIDYAGMFTLAAFFSRSVNAPGDYLEFGVFDGRTMSLAYHTMGKFNPDMKLIGFDTFQGITGALKTETDKYADGSYFANRETLEHNLAVAGVDRERVMLVEGDIRKTTLDPKLKQHLGIKRCLVANIDCDVYAVAKAALDFLTNIIDTGTLLLFDEYDQWGANNAYGERRALAEWLIENPQFQVEHYRSYAWAAQAFIVHRVE